MVLFVGGENLRSSLENRKKNNLYRSLPKIQNINGVFVKKYGKELISFASNDYFGLSGKEEIKDAAIKAIKKYGAGGQASRFVTGNHPLYEILEEKLSNYYGAENTLVFGSGYLANIGVISAFAGKGDLIIADKLIHSSLIDGIKLSGGKLKRFAHNDVGAAGKILKELRWFYKNCFIITENIFSMDGDKGSTEELFELANANDAYLIADNAHGFGFYKGKAHLQLGTLSKGIASYGGYLCASDEMIEYAKNFAKTAIYSTALPPSVIASAIKAIEIIENDKDLQELPLKKAKYFCSLLNLPEPESHIVPLIIGDEKKALELSKQLEDAGFLISAIRPPTVPKGTARLRISFSALHKEEQIESLSKIIKK